MRDEFEHEMWAINLFQSYTIERHMELLYLKIKLFETNQLSLEQLSITKYNPYYDQQLDCKRVVEGIIEWEQSSFFLSLLENAVNRDINLREFYKQFTEKQEEIAQIAMDREYSLNLKLPHFKAPIIFSIIGQIFYLITEERIDEFCLDILELKEDERFSSDYFYFELEKFYNQLRDLVQSEI